MGIFDAMAGTGVAMSADQLSDKTGADTQLIGEQRFHLLKQIYLSPD